MKVRLTYLHAYVMMCNYSIPESTYHHQNEDRMICLCQKAKLDAQVYPVCGQVVCGPVRVVLPIFPQTWSLVMSEVCMQNFDRVLLNQKWALCLNQRAVLYSQSGSTLRTQKFVCKSTALHQFLIMLHE